MAPLLNQIPQAAAAYEGQGHGFFNHRKGKNPFYERTVAAMDAFLVELGFLERAAAR